MLATQIQLHSDKKCLANGHIFLMQISPVY